MKHIQAAQGPVMAAPAARAANVRQAAVDLESAPLVVEFAPLVRDTGFDQSVMSHHVDLEAV